VKLNWKVVFGAVFAALVLLTSGCSGINASQSVSPATFLLPGLMRADPRPADPSAPLPETAPIIQVTQVR
jgi:hypothetical protein